MRISTLLFLCALSLSATAAYYSIVGLATIFSSSFWPVVVMAGILEISKLVVTSWLYHKWHQATNLIKIYLTSAVVVLMLITSLGIFGFLSKAHVEQSLINTEATLRIEQIDSQIGSIREIMQRYQTQLDQLDRSINIQLDSNRAAQALTARQRQQAERDQIRQRLDAEQQKLQELTQQRTTLRQRVSVLESEVGPIRYVAEFFVGSGTVDLEKAVRWMIVILVLVFDPLAVLMLIAANMSMTREAEPTGVAYAPPSEPMKPDALRIPLIGEARYFPDQGGMQWWNGTGWIALGIQPSSDDRVASAIEGMNKTVALLAERLHHIEPSVDLNQVRDVVKSSMDAWLTAASAEQHSISKNENTSENDTTDGLPAEPTVSEDAAPEQVVVESVIDAQITPTTSNTSIEVKEIASNVTTTQDTATNGPIDRKPSWL